MIRVVLDTNIVVSSLLTPDGNPAFIFKKFLLGEIQNFTTKDLLDEVKEVLNRAKITKRMNPLEREFTLNSLEKFSEKINPQLTFEEIEDDPDDNRILECAVAAAAEYIISGDDHLLKLKEFRGIKIISPAEFVRLIKKGEE
jgi:putative PIN family toxin of toxin-antitoxin system